MIRDVLNRCKIFSGSMLKLIAVLAMLIDHAAYTFRYQFPVLNTTLFTFDGADVTPYFLMRRIGRLAFPIFCFLIAEGIAHTRDIRKYGLRLLVFAVVSELPYNMLITHEWFYLGKQNIFFTLLLGVLLVYIYERIDDAWQKWLCMVLVLVAAVLLRVDYGVSGVVLIFVMHLFRDRAGAVTVLSFPLLGKVSAMLGLVPIFMYNGQRGFVTSRAAKYAFYLFYPLHMLALCGISYLLFKQGIWG